MHTVPWLGLEHSHTQRQHLDQRKEEKKKTEQETDTGQSNELLLQAEKYLTSEGETGIWEFNNNITAVIIWIF